MKKLVYSLLLLSLACMTIPAQTVIDSFLEKYQKEGNIRVVFIGKRMLNQIEEQSLGSPELLEAIKGLEYIQIIASEDTILSGEYCDSASLALEKDPNFTELYSVKTENLQLTVKVKETKDGINELIILSDDTKGFNLIRLIGNINLEALAKYSSRMDFEEFKKWTDN
jgi:hypothetical protein